MRRFLPLILLIAGLGLFFAFGLHHRVSLDLLREHRRAVEAWVGARPVLSALVFVLVYAVIVACSIPIALPMTLTGGFLFGPWEGAALAVCGATIGATGIFLAAKTALADFFRARLGERMRKMEDGFRANAFSYLLALRLMPVFPFALVNLAAGLLGMPLVSYVAATFLGIIPATLIYASVGNGLGALFETGAKPDLSIVLRPEIMLPLLGLAVLALLPVIWRAVRPERA